MTVKAEYLDYNDGDVTCEGYVAYDDATKTKRPGVLVSHAWAGQGKLERAKAEKLAELGYVGFALDLYGKGKRGASMEENAKLMQPFIDDRAMLRTRIWAALDAVKKHARVDADRVAAIGFCFGGLCVLDLARSVPVGLKGVVSFHGLFHPPKLGKQAPITSKVLMLHGYDDPMAKPESVVAIAQELTAAKADWQLHAYGRTSHAFTNPEANSPDHGLLYNATADRRSWVAMKNFLEEALA
jgi:dienelactone hydrolase